WRSAPARLLCGVLVLELDLTEVELLVGGLGADRRHDRRMAIERSANRRDNLQGARAQASERRAHQAGRCSDGLRKTWARSAGPTRPFDGIYLTEREYLMYSGPPPTQRYLANVDLAVG